jgi:hypothetical protein
MKANKANRPRIQLWKLCKPVWDLCQNNSSRHRQMHQRVTRLRVGQAGRLHLRIRAVVLAMTLRITPRKSSKLVKFLTWSNIKLKVTSVRKPSRTVWGMKWSTRRWILETQAPKMTMNRLNQNIRSLTRVLVRKTNSRFKLMRTMENTTSVTLTRTVNSSMTIPKITSYLVKKRERRLKLTST